MNTVKTLLRRARERLRDDPALQAWVTLALTVLLLMGGAL